MIPLLDCNLNFCQHDMVLAGTILPNGTFLGMVKVHHEGSEAHLVVATDWADPLGYVQSPNGESGNLFNTSFHPPDGVLSLCCCLPLSLLHVGALRSNGRRRARRGSIGAMAR
eukprot:SAG31_NODE_12541_length_934_cov_0.804790_2_plen_113_part_01